MTEHRADHAVGLRYGLVGKHQSLYRTNAVFKTHIDNLMVTLPLWVDAIAAASAELQARQDQAIGVINHNIGLPMVEALRGAFEGQQCEEPTPHPWHLWPESMPIYLCDGMER